MGVSKSWRIRSFRAVSGGGRSEHSGARCTVTLRIAEPDAAALRCRKKVWPKSKVDTPGACRTRSTWQACDNAVSVRGPARLVNAQHPHLVDFHTVKLQLHNAHAATHIFGAFVVVPEPHLHTTQADGYRMG